MGLLFDECIKSIEVVVFSKGTIGITSSTCRHCTLSMCSDSYPTGAYPGVPTSLRSNSLFFVRIAIAYRSA